MGDFTKAHRPCCYESSLLHFIFIYEKENKMTNCKSKIIH